MTRFREDAGYLTSAQIEARPKGPNGRPTCRFCSEEVPPGRRTFCSERCIHEWKIRTQGAYARKQVFKRDAGVCAGCGLDTEALKHQVHLAWVEWSKAGRQPTIAAVHEAKLKELFGRYPWAFSAYKRKYYPDQAWMVPAHTALWEADHLVPVAEGGGACGLSNLRTLCRPCHMEATKALRARLRAAKKNVTVG